MTHRDLIFIRDLKIETAVGSQNWEQAIQQTISLDLDIAADSIKTNQITQMSNRVIEIVSGSSHACLEALAEKLSGLLFAEFMLSWFRLVVRKVGDTHNMREIGIIIERSC